MTTITTLPSTVAALMRHDPIAVDPDESPGVAIDRMARANTRHWPVARDRWLLGIVSLHDLILLASPRERRALRDRGSVGRVTQEATCVVVPGDDIAATAERMLRDRITCLAVVEADEFVGTVTMADVVAHAVQVLEQEDEPRSVEELMTPTPLVVVGAHDRLDTARALMQRYGVRHLPVTSAGKLIGILSERDILLVQRTSLDPPSAIVVGESMTPTPETTAPGTRAAAAGRRLLSGRYGALPVVERGELVGILSRTDFLRFLVGSPET